jgi:hypothetical protein
MTISLNKRAEGVVGSDPGLTNPPLGNKNPEDQTALRVQRVTSSSAASAAIVTAIIAAPIGLMAAMARATLVAVVVMPSVRRGDIHDRMPRHGLIHHRRRTTHHGRRAIRHRRRAWRAHRDRARSVKDWQRQPKCEVHRNSCLGGAGQSDCGNHCYQTEQMFCFHGGSDGAVRNIFDSEPLIKHADH